MSISTYDLSTELDELAAREECSECGNPPSKACTSDECPLDDPLDDEERERLAALRALRDTLGGAFGDEVLIPESDFEDYARELAEGIGAIPDDLAWPVNCIDWEQAARELAMDYTSVTFEGIDYYVRL